MKQYIFFKTALGQIDTLIQRAREEAGDSQALGKSLRTLKNALPRLEGDIVKSDWASLPYPSMELVKEAEDAIKQLASFVATCNQDVALSAEATEASKSAETSAAFYLKNIEEVAKGDLSGVYMMRKMLLETDASAPTGDFDQSTADGLKKAGEMIASLTKSQKSDASVWGPSPYLR